jgi:hypothetical protein
LHASAPAWYTRRGDANVEQIKRMAALNRRLALVEMTKHEYLDKVTGIGVQFGLGRLRMSPEARYTHWTSTPIYGTFGDGPSYYSTQEQVDVLIGIGWRIH